jgi:sulfatase maturation enzyme AslB (radical SAM superfamily)
MPNFKSLEPTVNASFQVAWESTLKCNMDCTYCGDGHDNRLEHPSLESSLKTVDFIFDYLQIQMDKKPNHLKIAGLNIQGGESLFHPDIVEILTYINKKKQTVDYTLSVAMITNAVVGTKKWKEVVELLDYITLSYHSEMLPKQELMFRVNANYAKLQNKNFHISVLMHPKKWQHCLNIIDFCKTKNIKYVPRQIDHTWLDFKFNYSREQQEYLLGKVLPSTKEKLLSIITGGFDLSAKGRACCGGHALCTDVTCSTEYVMGNNFKGWHCSVNQFFLYIRQNTGEVFTNKDCRMNLDSKVAPLGYLSNTEEILKQAQEFKDTIICKKKSCWCGLCAPKAFDADTYESIIKKYLV